jgi:hypothetical protein
MKKSDMARMARECARRLKPFGKTIKDATDFYLRHLARKKSTGRPKGSGVLSGITPGSDEWTDIRKRMREGQQRAQFRAKVVHLLEIATWGTHARTADQQKPQANPKLDKLIERRKAEQAGLTKEQVMERKRKPHGLAKSQAEQDRKQRELAASVRSSLRSQRVPVEDLTLTPAGKFTDAMASDIYNALEIHVLPNGLLLVEGCQFESKERVMEAIHDLARRLQFELKKQPRKKSVERISKTRRIAPE